MGTGDILLGVTLQCTASYPAGVAILLGMLHAKETGIRSGRLCLWLVCAFTFYYTQLPGGEGVLRISSDGSKDFFGFEIFAIFSKIASFQGFSLNHWRFFIKSPFSPCSPFSSKSPLFLGPRWTSN